MIDLNNYRIDFVCCIDDTIFLDIIDKRNGEVYSFYKNKHQDQNYTFYDNHQMWDIYLCDKKSIFKDKENNPFDFDVIYVAKPRPINPFEKYSEYQIKFDSFNKQIFEITLI